MRFFFLASTLVLGCYNPGDLGETPFSCYTMYPECPDGYRCQLDSTKPNLNRCVRTAGGSQGPALVVPKSSTYTGTRSDNGITAPDSREPNNGIAEATTGSDLSLLENVSIYPAGDIDVFAVNGSGKYMRARLTYTVSYGDLDIGIFDGNGTPIVSDGSAVNNGCVATSGALSGIYYIAILGAGGTDTNRYTLRVDQATTQLSCTSNSDGGV